jgi:hypothetical protein
MAAKTGILANKRRDSVGSHIKSGGNMKRIALFACIGLFGLTQFASATSLTFTSVGTINGNGRTFTEATGNTINKTTFASDLATAFANDKGGVWNFDTPATGGFFVNSGETITLNYGASLNKSVVLTLSGNQINQAQNVAAEATSGGFALGLATDGSTRTFTLDTPMLEIAIFNTKRFSSATSALTVTFMDDTTATTSGANGNDWFFHELSGTLANPIKSFSLVQSGFIRYDDLAFVAVPEPAGLSFLGIGALVTLRRRRR